MRTDPGWPSRKTAYLPEILPAIPRAACRYAMAVLAANDIARISCCLAIELLIESTDVPEVSVTAGAPAGAVPLILYLLKLNNALGFGNPYA